MRNLIARENDVADELIKGALFEDFVVAYVEGSKRTEDEETMLKKVG